MMDVETVDLLLAAYMQVLESMRAKDIPHSLSHFEKMMEFAKQKLKISEVGVNFLKTLLNSYSFTNHLI
ncbi:MAG: hypothetical protein GY749_13245 [Desulfobacteraceae bacterium]|nr:hypothetical protein [Desulfobacteraceae bacterium]